MWTATLDNSAADESVTGMTKVTITYNNDDGRTTTVTERLSDPDSYKKLALDKINELNRLDAVAEFIKNPPLGVIDFTPPEPTPEESAQQDYQTKRQDLITKKQDLDLGLIEQTDYDAAVAATQTASTAVSSATLRTM